MPLMKLTRCNKQCEECGSDFTELESMGATSVQLWCAKNHLTLFTGIVLRSLSFEAERDHEAKQEQLDIQVTKIKKGCHGRQALD